MGHFKSLFQNSLLLLFSFILVDYSRNYFSFAICHPMYFICVLYITYTITQLKIKCTSIVMYVCEWVQGMCTPQCVWGEQAITSNVPFDFLFGPGSLVVWNCIGQARWPTSFWRVSCPSSHFLIGVLALQICMSPCAALHGFQDLNLRLHIYKAINSFTCWVISKHQYVLFSGGGY